MTSPARADTVPSGLLVIDKPAGWTSHQVVSRVRRLVGTRKVGHAGTLDPMATGVLVVGVNRATRLLGHLTLTDKAYAATIRLGQATDTDDAEGEVTTAPGAAGVTDAAVEVALRPFRGPIQQVPSAVSAIKVAGVRAYAKVRAGETVTLAARPVEVRRFDVIARRAVVADGLSVVDLDVVVECTSGTYIRALARDLGAALGTGGHLTALRRTRVGPFLLDEAVVLPEVESAGPTPVLLGMPDVARRCFPTVTLTAEQARDVGFGRRLSGLDLGDAATAVLSPGGDFLALYRADGDGARPDAVFVGSSE